ncbi:MAG: class I SAM-dependent methyltransferase [bacterium]|nr:class I SAM-dependent methyltransferase [bacterium]
MDYSSAVREIKKKYKGLGWPSLFIKIRFFTAPYRKLEADVPRDGFIIDLGCGYGIFSNLLALLSSQREILGLELDMSKIKYADRGLGNVHFQAADITRAQIPSADCILLIHVLHHLNSYSEQEVLIRACYDKLKEGGKLIICEIDRYPWWKFILTQMADHLLYPGDRIYYRFPAELLSFLKTLQFNIQYQKSHQGTPFSHVTYVCEKRTSK